MAKLNISLALRSEVEPEPGSISHLQGLICLFPGGRIWSAKLLTVGSWKYHWYTPEPTIKEFVVLYRLHACLQIYEACRRDADHIHGSDATLQKLTSLVYVLIGSITTLVVQLYRAGGSKFWLIGRLINILYNWVTPTTHTPIIILFKRAAYVITHTSSLKNEY